MANSAFSIELGSLRIHDFGTLKCSVLMSSLPVFSITVLLGPPLIGIGMPSFGPIGMPSCGFIGMPSCGFTGFAGLPDSSLSATPTTFDVFFSVEDCDLPPSQVSGERIAATNTKGDSEGQKSHRA